MASPLKWKIKLNNIINSLILNGVYSVVIYTYIKCITLSQYLEICHDYDNYIKVISCILDMLNNLYCNLNFNHGKLSLNNIVLLNCNGIYNPIVIDYKYSTTNTSIHIVSVRNINDIFLLFEKIKQKLNKLYINDNAEKSIELNSLHSSVQSMSNLEIKKYLFLLSINENDISHIGVCNVKIKKCIHLLKLSNYQAIKDIIRGIEINVINKYYRNRKLIKLKSQKLYADVYKYINSEGYDYNELLLELINNLFM
jgi:hypothetical protein